MNSIINILLDPVVNFGKVTLSAGYNSIVTSITLNTGDGSKLPSPATDGSFNLIWFNNSVYFDPADDPNVEIVRCIARVGDALTLMRGQEGTSASNKNTAASIYRMILSPTKKTISDIQTDSQSKVSTHAAITSSVHNFDASGNAPAQLHGSTKHTGIIGDHGSLTSIGTNTHTQIDTAITNSTNHISTATAHGVTSNIVGISDSQSLTNKTITDPTNNVAARSLKSSTTLIDISSSPAPSAGQVLTATSPAAATWQAPSSLSLLPLSSPIFNEWNGTPSAATDQTFATSFSNTRSSLTTSDTWDVIYDLGALKHIIIGIMGNLHYFGSSSTTSALYLYLSDNNIDYYISDYIKSSGGGNFDQLFNLKGCGYTRYILLRHVVYVNSGGSLSTTVDVKEITLLTV